MLAVFTGFDSAWGASNCGALCDLLLDGDSLRIACEPLCADWASSLARAKQHVNADLQVWAIDQPLVVNNVASCRPVERDLARALMADFGCGAHSSNRSMAAWAETAPVWNLLQILEKEGYSHNPMAIPGAGAGRFYFECYPHPAIIGLFDLNRILQYKVHHRNQADWQTLIRLLRSLASAELPIWNIEGFIPEILPQNKLNEDRLDSILAAYTAAYWWRFGIRRSTVIGDAYTGYLVVPHSDRTFAALGRVFAGRMNSCGAVNEVPKPAQDHEQGRSVEMRDPKLHSGIPVAPNEPPVCDWVYFATPTRWSGTITESFVREHQVIVRNVHYKAGKRIQRIPNVQHLKAGQRILLVYGGGRDGNRYRAVLSATISASTSPPRSDRCCFDVFTCIDEDLDRDLQAGGYVRDPVFGRFAGITITDIQVLRHSDGTIRRPSADRKAIWRWEEVFGS